MKVHQDNSIESTSPENQIMAASANASFSDFPTLDNGMLKFRDNDHYDKYLDFLSATIDGLNSTDTLDANDALSNIEKKIGFTSIRSIAHAAFLEKDKTGWSRVEDIPDEHFLNAIDLRSILNKDLNVRIGDEIVHYISKDYAVRVNVTEIDLLKKYQTLDVTATQEQIFSLDARHQKTTVYELTGAGSIWEKPNGPFTPLGEYHIAKINDPVFPDPCNMPNNVRFDGLLCSYNWGPGLECSFSVNYGDNSPVETKYSTVVFGSYETPKFFHNYPGPGVYNLSVRAYSPNHDYLAYKEKEVTVRGACQPIEKNSGWYYKNATNNADKMVGGRLYIEFYGSSSNKMRMIAETRSYVRKTGNIFHLGKGKIEVNAQCSAKNGQCNEIDLLQAYQLKNNSKEFLEHRSKNQRFYWTTASSVHSITVDGVVTNLPISIKVCP